MALYSPCRLCSNNEIPGYLKDELGRITPCTCYKEYQNRLLMELLLQKANVPITIIDYDIDSYVGTNSLDSVEKIKKYITIYKEKAMQSHLYIQGSNATQKTTLSFYIARELLKQQVSVYYVPTINILIDRLCVFENQITPEIKSFLNKVLMVDLLIIDECFTSKYGTVSDYQINHLRSFLKQRIEISKKSTIFISNTTIQNISKEGFTPTIQSLIERETFNNVLNFNDYYDKSKIVDINNLWS